MNYSEGIILIMRGRAGMIPIILHTIKDINRCGD